MIQQEKRLILKDIKELSPEIELTQHNSQKFLLEIKDKHELKFLEIQKDSHLTLKTKKNANIDIALGLEGAKSLKLNLDLDENSSMRITCFSNKPTNIMCDANCNENSKLELTNFATSSIVSESKTNLKKNASCIIKTGYYDEGGESKNNGVVIHQEKNTKSLIMSKGYLTNSKSDSRALIRIDPDASDSEGFQESHMLLEGDSKAISVPDLEILNNEVKCSHGSTISRIKNEDLFYFEARGISKTEAKKMLIKGHLLSLITENEELKSFAESFIERGLK